MIRILHAADLHLDSPFESLPEEKAALRRSEQRALLRSLAQLRAETGAELVLLMAQRMLEEQRKNELLQQELRLAKPKADFYDAFIHPECCTNLRATAKELKVPEKMFTAFLIRKRYLYRAPSGTLLPYAKPASDGLFFVKDYIAVNGHQGVYTLVTPKGKSLFLTMLGEIA